MSEWNSVKRPPSQGGIFRVRLKNRRDVELQGTYFDDPKRQHQWLDAFSWSPIEIRWWREITEADDKILHRKR